jgi:hypothetical protein
MVTLSKWPYTEDIALPRAIPKGHLGAWEAPGQHHQRCRYTLQMTRWEARV